jgi:hypothetical protein
LTVAVRQGDPVRRLVPVSGDEAGADQDDGDEDDGSGDEQPLLLGSTGQPRLLETW